MVFQRRKINRNNKDVLFGLTFQNKKDLLQLYNAVNETNYTDEQQLEITTLGDAVYMAMKNDVSFLVSNKMNLYEHQSTFNPNMPIRGFEYFAELYSAYLEKNELDVYGSSLIKLPTPQYVVFYNGTKEQPEKTVLKLSDAFEKIGHNGIEPAIEVQAIMLNINLGHNQLIMEKCKKLKEYAQLIAMVREYINQGYSIEEASDFAVSEAIENNILRDILVKNRAEVIMNFLYEYDEERHMRNERALARKEGLAEGRQVGERLGREAGEKLGREEGENKFAELSRRLLSNGRTEDLLRATQDKEYREKLYQEFAICESVPEGNNSI